jgi:hypothetical protein
MKNRPMLEDPSTVHGSVPQDNPVYSPMDDAMGTKTQEKSFLTNPLLTPSLLPQNNMFSELEYVQSNSLSPTIPSQLPHSSESPLPCLENVSVICPPQTATSFVGGVLHLANTLADPASISSENLLGSRDRLVNQFAGESEGPSPIAESQSSWPRQATLSVAPTAIVEIVYWHLNYLASSAISPKYLARPVDQLLTQLFETSIISVRPHFDLYLALKQKTALELQMLLGQLSFTDPAVESPQNLGDSIPGVTTYKKGNSGEIGYCPIVDNWNAIIESALWLWRSASVREHYQQQ